MKEKVATVDAYIALFPEDIQKELQHIRKVIQEAAPNAQECISYHMPAYKQNGILVYFSACKSHYGFYPTPSAIVFFQSELSNYVTSKGAVQFQMNEAIPFDLIKKMVLFKVEENNRK